ncbi:MAG TPA: hypothetical protein VLK30_04030 [Candidatus Limnocylindrales bacterium]|nr:hypothetical protein [Candidatus Limnocylindrales bacterium]
MRPAFVAVMAVAMLATACSPIPGIGSSGATSAASAARAAGTPLAKASGALDAEVAVPPGFPSDVPVYDKARLTAAASFASSGQVTWGMEWQTMDSLSKIQAFYQKKLNEGDWTFKLSPASTPSVWTGTISRKSNPRIMGTFAVDGDVTVNRILLSLLSPA